MHRFRRQTKKIDSRDFPTVSALQFSIIHHSWPRSLLQYYPCFSDQKCRYFLNRPTPLSATCFRRIGLAFWVGLERNNGEYPASLFSYLLLTHSQRRDPLFKLTNARMCSSIATSMQLGGEVIGCNDADKGHARMLKSVLIVLFNEIRDKHCNFHLKLI